MKYTDLPIYQQRQRIVDAVAQNSVIVIESPTGSGKTTQIPLILHQHGFSDKGIIGVTQPRRIAAISVCEYIARQIDSPVPGTAGYKIRFSDLTNADTAVKIMTDGILLQEMKADRLLSRYSMIMVDEAHERSLDIDFILGLLKQVIRERPEFKVIISSATINTTVFSNYFDGCPILHVDAIIHPVELRYMPLESSDRDELLLETIAQTVSKRVRDDDSGDILIFLPGERAIMDCVKQLYRSDKKRKLLIIPIFGRLPREEQERVFIETPEGKTKVVIATNIAETSITIDNIRTVIDAGTAKINYYNPKTFTSSLIEQPISKASCNQRKGRAGRTAPGVCYRLYSKEDYDHRPLYTLEEIKRTDLSEVVLRMAELGISDFLSFDFITDPGIEGIDSAIDTLKLLGALNERNELTTIGEMMVQFPLLPRLSRMIVEAIIRYHDVLEETIIAAAFLSARSPFILPTGEEIEARNAHHTFSSEQGDFSGYLKLYRTYQTVSTEKQKEHFCKTHYLEKQTMDEIINISLQFIEIVSDMGIPIASGGSMHDYLCSISAGLVQFICIRDGRNIYRSLTADKIHIHPGSVLFRSNPRYIVAGEIVRTSRMFARSVAVLKKEWLDEINPVIAREFIRNTSEGGRKKAPEERAAGGAAKTFLGKRFPVEPYKGKKKMVVVPLEFLQRNQRAIEAHLGRYSGMRMKVSYRSHFFHIGDRLARIIRILPHINLSAGILDAPPAGSFILNEDLQLLTDNLELLLACVKLKRADKSLGFIALETDKVGNFRFRAVKNFYSALDTTLYNLDFLIDRITDQAEQQQIQRINRIYRRLTEIYES